MERPFGFSSSKPLIKFNCKADIWSLGCILYNLVYGRSPFGHVHSVFEKVQAICDPRVRIDFPHLDDQLLMDCLRVCLLASVTSCHAFCFTVSPSYPCTVSSSDIFPLASLHSSLSLSSCVPLFSLRLPDSEKLSSAGAALLIS